MAGVRKRCSAKDSVNVCCPPVYNCKKTHARMQEPWICIAQDFELLGEWLAWSVCSLFTSDLHWWIICELIQISANGSGSLFSHHLLVASITCCIFRYHLLFHVCSGEKDGGWKDVPWLHQNGSVLSQHQQPLSWPDSPVVVTCSLHVTSGEWVVISIRRLIKQRHHLHKEVLGSSPWEVVLKNTLKSYLQELPKRSSSSLGAANSLEDHWLSTLFPEIYDFVCNTIKWKLNVSCVHFWLWESLHTVTCLPEHKSRCRVSVSMIIFWHICLSTAWQ